MEKNKVSEDGGKKLADYALFFDLFSTIGASINEREVIDGIAGVFHAICTPAYVAYLPFYGDRSGPLKCRPRLAAEQEAGIAEKLAVFDKEYAWTASGNGFVMRISYAGEKLGVIELEGMAFPEYREQYLNLALNSAAVLGLAISNARNYHALEEKNKELAASELRFRQLSDASFEGIIINIEGRVVDCNTAFARMFGYEPEEIVGTVPLHLYPPESLTVIFDHIKRGSEDVYDVVGTKKDGTPIFVEVRGRNILHHGRKARITAVRDITDRKAAEDKLNKAKEEAEEATKLKDKFISLVSHDLKTPLSSMIGFLKLVRNDYAGSQNGDAQQILDRTVESGQAMIRLIDDLLTISRFKTGQLKLNRQFFDAEYLGAMMAANCAYLAEQKGIGIENTIPVNYRIYGDKTLLTEAVQNLVTNAIKFCKSGDHITISSVAGDFPLICVRDTGPGISPNLLGDLFKFEKKTSTTGTAGETGTGFGLPLVKEIMQLHGGGLAVESESGKGCLFCLKLPYVRPKILLVDDDRNSRLLQMMQLREMKADIIEADNGQDALDKMAGVRPDLVITDIQMPVMDGLELLKRIKGAPETKDIPVIVQSGEFGMEMRDTIFKFGGDDFVTKKVDKADFFPRVRRFIG